MTSSYPPWSDGPAIQDLLSLRAVAETAADAGFDPVLDPAAIGLSGSWGSGRTRVLELIKAEVLAGEPDVDGLLPSAVQRMTAFTRLDGAAR
jgi:hypothetical protein